MVSKLEWIIFSILMGGVMIFFILSALGILRFNTLGYDFCCYYLRDDMISNRWSSSTDLTDGERIFCQSIANTDPKPHYDCLNFTIPYYKICEFMKFVQRMK